MSFFAIRKAIFIIYQSLRTKLNETSSGITIAEINELIEPNPPTSTTIFHQRLICQAILMSLFVFVCQLVAKDLTGADAIKVIDGK